MMVKIDGESTATVGYGCPIIEVEKGVDVDEQWKQRRIRYRACPKKFAELHNYHKEDMLKALAIFRTFGDGRHIWMDEYINFEKMALRTGDEVRSTWTFKRTISTAEDHSDLEEEETVGDLCL